MLDEHFDIFNDETTLQIVSLPEKQERRTRVTDVLDLNGTRHEAVVPAGAEYTLLPGAFEKPSAKQYSFELDLFQKLSLCVLERDETVLVSAHTSSGKTVVAEYAIAMSLKNNQRVVYTSPIKALSNQKYRELLEEFGDVGLMTGDVTINPTASCLVMTTEILRNMLYRGSEVTREVHWIVFDEIHYMRDKERGVVWEEAIILLPSHVRMVFLSATIPNALEFAEWISFIQRQVVHVVYTEKRVTPLVHYFRTDRLYRVKDAKFHRASFLNAMRSVRSGKIKPRQVVQAVNEAALPVVVFSFKRKECESFALHLQSDFLNACEKETVKTIFTNAVGSLRKEDRSIPLVQNILPLLLRGIGIHHSGLLPLIKEVVEILFQEGLLRVLFATETFSIGLNMPAKSVMFTALKKFDGERTRFVTSGEYIQMSGRAGRRGIDTMGIVTSLISEPMTLREASEIFSSSADTLKSAFRLTYNMILNLMRVEGLDSLYILSRSFHHFQAYKEGIEQEEEMHAMYYALKELAPNELARLLQRREQLRMERARRLEGRHAEYLKKGRVVGLFMPRNGASLSIRNAIVSKVRGDEVHCMVLTGEGVYLNAYPLEYVESVYNVRVKLDMRVFLRKFERVEIPCDLDHEVEQVEEGILRLEPSYDFEHCLLCGMKYQYCLLLCGTEFNAGNLVCRGDSEHERNGHKRNEHERKNGKGSRRAMHTDSITKEKVVYDSPVVREAREYFSNELQKKRYMNKLMELDKLKEIYHMDECRKMINVLKKLEYCDDTTVLMKGRMACEISSGDELILTEMIFNGDFAEMPIEQLVPLLSCIVFEEWDSDGFVLSAENERSYKILSGTVMKVCGVLREYSLDTDAGAYLKRFSYELMDVVRLWVEGHTFIEICEKTSVFEGSIIRTFKRLEELLRQLGSAARVIGNTELENVFSSAIIKIKRDIIFANSLYL
jgi:ATP-dependent RNA helicase DOB1